MFLEKMFGNTFGIIWLIIFSLAVLSLIVWLLVKKDNVVTRIEKEQKEDFKEEVAPVEEKVEEVLEEPKKEEKTSEYEIVEIDGFFKVRKVGSERTIRKFFTKKEAINYVKEKEND